MANNSNIISIQHLYMLTHSFEIIDFGFIFKSLKLFMSSAMVCPCSLFRARLINVIATTLFPELFKCFFFEHLIEMGFAIYMVGPKAAQTNGQIMKLFALKFAYRKCMSTILTAYLNRAIIF